MNVTRPLPKWQELPWWVRLAFLVAAVNFVSFWGGSFLLGGTAMHGCQQDGHYFLREGGTHTEVSEARWTYSLYHGRSMWATHAALFVTLAIFVNTARGRDYV